MEKKNPHSHAPPPDLDVLRESDSGFNMTQFYYYHEKNKKACGTQTGLEMLTHFHFSRSIALSI